MSPYLGAMRYRQNQDFHQNIFQDLLQKQNIPAPVLEERLHWQLGYMKWKPEDLFCLLTLHPERKDFSPDLLILAGNQLRKLFPQTSVFTMEDHIVMVCDQEKNAMENLFAVLREYLLENHFAAGMSLPDAWKSSDITISRLWQQFLMGREKTENPLSVIFMIMRFLILLRFQIRKHLSAPVIRIF